MSDHDFDKRPWRERAHPDEDPDEPTRPTHEKAYTAGALAVAAGILLYAITNRSYGLCQSAAGEFAQMFSSQAASQCSTVAGAHLIAIVLIVGGVAGFITGCVMANKNKK